MQEDYSQATAKSLTLAYFEARDVRAAEVGSEHLLVGLAGITDCGAARLLARLGLSDAELRDHLDKRPPLSPAAAMEHLPIGPSVTEAFERTLLQTQRTVPNARTTIDLLLSVVDDPRYGGARELVQRCGVTPETIASSARNVLPEEF